MAAVRIKPALCAANEMKNSLKKLLYTLTALALAAAFCSLCACSLVEQKRKDDDEKAAILLAYEQGVNCYNNGNFLDARSYFIASGMYGDSAKYIEIMDGYENLYNAGVAAMNAGDYRTALSNFLAIPDYLNSQTYIDRINKLRADYDSAVALYTNGDYLAARAAFAALGGYEQSEAYVENIDKMAEWYNMGIELYNSGNYEQAMNAFRAINAVFADSDHMIELCREQLLDLHIKLNDYIRNYNEGYDGAERIEGSNYADYFILVDSIGIHFTGIKNGYDELERIEFHFSEEVREKLGEEGVTEALCHCIHALNPYVADIDDIRADLTRYTLSNGSAYGAMWVRLSEVGGDFIVEAFLRGTGN